MVPPKTSSHPSLARRTVEVEESTTLAVAERAARLRASGIDVISFAAGEPDFDTPDHIKQAAVDAIAKGYTKYTPSSGIPALRAAVAAKFRRDQGLEFDPAQVLISCGAKHAIYNALHAILDPGDEAVVVAPYWTSYPEMVKTADARPIIIQTTESSGFKLAPRDLAAAVTPRTKVLIHCSPGNPTGSVYTRSELEAIARIVIHRGLFVISDEVYEKLTYGATPHISIVTLGPDIRERTIVVNSCSKTYSMTGWRIGYSAGPPDVMAAAAKMQSQATSNPTSIAQHAALAALQGDHAFLAPMVEEYRRRRDAIVARLRSMPGLSVVAPEGAFYVFPKVSAFYGRRFGDRPVQNSTDLADLLLDEAHIAVVPGAGFGNDAHLRISYATSLGKITEGMNRMEQVLRALV